MLNLIAVLVLAIGAGAQFRDKVIFHSVPPAAVVVRKAGDTVELECEAAGSPTPTIHWLFNGVRLPQGGGVVEEGPTYEREGEVGKLPALRSGSGRGKIYIDCMSAQDQGIYTCVADTEEHRIVSKTKLTLDGAPDDVLVDKCIRQKVREGSGARIYLSTVNRLEIEGRNVELFCRAEGNPAPRITWYDRQSVEIKPDNREFMILANGDLVVKNIQWAAHMGVYTCKADNGINVANAESFLYPTLP